MNLSIVDLSEIESGSYGQTKRVVGGFPFDNRVVLLLSVVGEIAERVGLKHRRWCDEIESLANYCLGNRLFNCFICLLILYFNPRERDRERVIIYLTEQLVESSVHGMAGEKLLDYFVYAAKKIERVVDGIQTDFFLLDNEKIAYLFVRFKVKISAE